MATDDSALTSASPTVKTPGALTSVLLLCLIPPAILAAGWFLQPVWAWATIMVLLATFTVLVGHHVVKLWRGPFIDDRNMISLSRFQTILWTVLVVAGLLAAALHNVRSKQPDPLGIAIPAQLWALLGISVTALVGSALIKGQQATQEVANLAAASKKTNTLLKRLGDSNTLVDPHEKPVVAGVLPVNAKPADSSWSDMFRAEQIGSQGKLDLGKIQMFYFTIILVFVYAAALATVLRNATGRIGEFPALDNSMVALLGISSAAYLANKSIPRSDTSQGGQGTSTTTSTGSA